MSETHTKEPVLVEGTAVLPVSVDELRNQIRMTSTEEDATLNDYLRAATAKLQSRLGRKFITQTYDVYYTGFSNPMVLPFAPLSSAGVISVKYLDSSQVLQTCDASIWEVGEKHGRPTVRLKYNQSWPSTLGHADDVVIRASFGYGSTGVSVPAPIKQAIVLLAAWMNEYREPGNIDWSIIDCLTIDYRFNSVAGSP